MKTTLHTYSFNLENQEDREPYHQLKTMLEKTPGRGHKMHASKARNDDFEVEAGPIELEPEFLFENQWNSDKGRVFDWFEEAIFSPYNGQENKLIKRGHYLEITPEMEAIRRTTLKCGWTGQQFPESTTPRFNLTQSAIGSPYLKESELHLLRLKPVSDTSSREPLTDTEREFLLPLYIQAQTKSTDIKNKELRASLEKDYIETCANAKTERDGFLWLLDHGVNTENCIYYTHTKRFGFGWRSPYPEAAKVALLEALKKFPFDYDVK